MKKARREKEVEQVRQAILEGALEIIVKEGFDSLTMRKLAKRIGMTAPNIYNYFSGKDALYISIVIKGFKMLHAVLAAAYSSSGDSIARARAMIEAYIRFGMEKPRYYDIMFTRPTPKYNDYIGTPHEQLSEVEYRISMEIADLALRATEAVLGRGDNSELARMRVVQFWSLLHGMVTLHNSQVVSYVAEDTEAMYRKIVSELIGLLSLFRSGSSKKEA